MGGKSPPLLASRRMYFLEGGLLVTSNLIKTEEWVHDDERSHCNVCVQQFMPFRRRHHCRTCGEVVCGGCSSRRKVHLIAVKHVECTTRVCSFCVIHATDASIQVNECALRETALRASVAASSSRPLPGLPSVPSSATDLSTDPSTARLQSANRHREMSYPSVAPLSKQFSMLSMESELTDGSVVQLWPNPTAENESVRMKVAYDSQRLTSENDPTMTLLVSIVARTLECPVAFIGIMDATTLHFKATTGWDCTSIPRDDCACAIQDKTMIVSDTNVDKHFHANNLCIDGQPVRYFAGAPIRVMGQCIGAVCAIDEVPHAMTQPSMRSTLEAVANIVSEVVEQRVGHSYQGEKRSLQPSLPRKTAGPRSTFAMTQSLSSLAASEVPVLGASIISRESEYESEDDEDDEDKRAWATNKVHPWPRARSNTRSGARYSLAVPMGPPEVGEKIARAMECFQLLRGSRWTATVVEDTVRAFEKEMHGCRFSKSHMTLAGDCTHVIADLQTYDDDYVYADVFARVVRRAKLSVQTWTDVVVLRSNMEGEETPVLSHWRQYPDGSNIIVAFRNERQQPPELSDFLFGWFVAPAAADEHGNSVHVSCIVAEDPANQIENVNLSLEMLTRLQQSLPFRYDFPRSHSSRPSEVSQRSSDEERMLLRASRGDAMALVNAPPNGVSLREHAHAHSALNENERMMLDLLDKTISTQEVLAAQQHVMANVIDYHGSQLERISSALDRVETILSHNGDKIRQLSVAQDRKSVAV